MTIDLITTLQQQLLELEQREADVAAAAEALSQDAAVQRAIEQGIQIERQRVLALMDHQQGLLRRAAVTHMTLTALRRMVASPDNQP